ncbi:MAG: TIGR00299 family protein, partial [Firmicutes bacterium HGW-Firmicutes-17]
YVLEVLLQNGALDAFYTPVYMKKNRPGIHLTVLCSEAKLPLIEEIILKETSTIGIRKFPVERTCMHRHFKKIATPLGEVTIKMSQQGDITRATPEYEDVKKIAQESGKSLWEVLEMVEKLK